MHIPTHNGPPACVAYPQQHSCPHITQISTTPQNCGWLTDTTKLWDPNQKNCRPTSQPRTSKRRSEWFKDDRREDFRGKDPADYDAESLLPPGLDRVVFSGRSCYDHREGLRPVPASPFRERIAFAPRRIRRGRSSPPHLIRCGVPQT